MNFFSILSYIIKKLAQFLIKNQVKTNKEKVVATFFAAENPRNPLETSILEISVAGSVLPKLEKCSSATLLCL